MFSLKRLPVTQQMFPLFHKDYFIPKIPQFVCHVMFRNPQERAVTTNNIHNVHRNMSNVFYNQSSGLILKYIFDNISTGCVGFSITPGETMAALLCYATLTLRAPTYPLTLINKSLKLCLKTVDTLGKP